MLVFGTKPCLHLVHYNRKWHVCMFRCDRFKDTVECERVVVKAFLTPHEVATFRASTLSEGFYQVKAEMEKMRSNLMTSYSEGSKLQMTRGKTLALTCRIQAKLLLPLEIFGFSFWSLFLFMTQRYIHVHF